MTNTTNGKTVIIADDHFSVRTGLAQSIGSYEGWNVIGLAEDGDMLLQQMAATPADLVIADLRMPGGGGIAAGKLVKEQYPATRLLAHISNDTDEIFLALLKAGYDGITVKRASEREIIMAMNSVVAGDYGFCKIAWQRVKRLIEEKKFNPKSRLVKAQITDRELKVFVMISEGLSNKEMGKKMGLSSRTVEDIRDNLKEKLNASSTPEMIRLGCEQGLLDLTAEK